jgi:hypothetical protein
LKLEGGKEDGGPWLWGAVEVEEKVRRQFTEITLVRNFTNLGQKGNHGNIFISILFDVVN